MIPELGNPKIITHTTWAVLLLVTVGLMLIFTPVRNLDKTEVLVQAAQPEVV